MAEISMDPNDPLPVTPYALLTLRDEPVSSPLNSTKKDLLSYGKARWRRVQYLADQFWSRWKADYISTLQTRSKWKKKTKNLKENDLVLIKQSSHRNAWPMGRVTKCNRSKDGLIRSVVLTLRPLHDGAPRTLERSIHDLVLLVEAWFFVGECRDSSRFIDVWIFFLQKCQFYFDAANDIYFIHINFLSYCFIFHLA